MTLSIEWTTEITSSDGTENTTELTFHRLEFDAVLREGHTATSDITTHPVEVGAAIADHKRPNPRTITLEGYVTNTPLDAPPPSGGEVSSVTATITDSTVTFSTDFDRVADVWEVLERLRLSAQDLTINTRWRTYENVQLTEVNVERSTPEDAVSFNLTLVEVFRAATELVAVPTPREPRGAREETASADTQEDTQPERRQSWLWRALT